MDFYILPFLSVMLGYALTFSMNSPHKNKVKLLLAFSGAFLLTITVTHLLPNIYEQVIEKIHHNHHEPDIHDHVAFKSIGLFIMLGIFFQIILEFFSKGAEHGHTHIHKSNKTHGLLFISLCIHALFEGMPVSQHQHLAWAIAIHHLPIAIILTLFFNQSKQNKSTTFIFMLIFALMTPLGTLISEHTPLLIKYYSEISAFVIGILLHISSTIIFESSEGHKFNAKKITAILLGIIIAMFL